MTPFERTKEFSKKRGYSLQTTAINAGLSKNAIYNWKTKEPSDVSIKAVADVLGVSFDYLKGNVDDPTPSHLTQPATQTPVDLTEVADNENWDEWLTSNGRPLTDHDKKVLSALFGSE